MGAGVDVGVGKEVGVSVEGRLTPAGGNQHQGKNETTQQDDANDRNAGHASQSHPNRPSRSEHFYAFEMPKQDKGCRLPKASVCGTCHSRRIIPRVREVMGTYR